MGDRRLNNNRAHTTISLIIPTRNRPADLVETVDAVLKQMRCPDELIIVDQSTTGGSNLELRQAVATQPRIRLIYIWDHNITGLPMARNAGFAASTGDLVCYLDDDVTPAPDYLAQVEKGFEEFPAWAGLCGRFSDDQPAGAGRRLIRSLFRLGLFRDDRARLATMDRPLDVRLLCGGAACLRREVMRQFQFDENLTGYALGEDFDFCLRAGSRFGFGGLPAVRWHHRRSAVGRPDAARMRVMARASAGYLWRAHRRHIGDDLAYLWLISGFRLERVFSSAARSLHRSWWLAEVGPQER
jgi:glycosyltransferase involved in cell wall biosynthesis